MGLLGLFGKQSADGTVTESTSYADTLSSLLSTETITEEKVMKIPTAKKCLDLITNTIAQMPVYLYKENADGSIEKVLDDNRVRLLNHESNEYTKGFVLKQNMVKNTVLHGASYIKIESAGNKILSLHPIDTPSVTVNKKIKYGYKVVGADILLNSSESGAFNSITKKQPIYKAHDFIITTTNKGDGLTGVGVLKQGQETFELALSEMKHSKHYFKTGALPIGILHTEDGITLNEKQRDSIKENWQQLYGGVENSHKTVLLPAGLKYEQLSQPTLPTKENRNSFAIDICKVFNMPDVMISNEGTKHQSLEQNNKAFHTTTLSPIIVAMESALDKSLLLEKEKEKGYFFRFDTSELLRATEKERTEAVAIGLEKGLLTINEARAKLDLPNIEDDIFMWGLQHVLYNPKTGEMKVPNMGLTKDKHSPKVPESEEIQNAEDN
ncbi:phage portal protein [Bacillus wiedmannii]|uniref:phage portal protein n=1 Tax=Bacillus wiedmannii TaxID=1890302 RepID=UPI000BF8C02E|nr:phage portal protein [Bacillus wiedmannii]PGC57704.1 phage portal protein [Bacillus wiedmannii]